MIRALIAALVRHYLLRDVMKEHSSDEQGGAEAEVSKFRRGRGCTLASPTCFQERGLVGGGVGVWVGVGRGLVVGS